MVIAACPHVCVVVSHVSVVQLLASPQSPSPRQQLAIGALVQVPPAAQLSVVHALLSLQSVAVVQQLGMDTCVHVCVVVLHASVVHERPSLQSLAA